MNRALRLILAILALLAGCSGAPLAGAGAVSIARGPAAERSCPKSAPEG